MKIKTLLVGVLLSLMVFATGAFAEEKFIPVDIMPELMHIEEPVYPEKAKKDGILADVWIKAYVDQNGKVTHAKAEKCTEPGYGFEDSALAAAKLCTYKAAIQDGRPVGVWISYKVSFVLADKDNKDPGGKG